MALNTLDIIIPVYQPGEALIKLVPELLTADFHHIVIVNDGSDAAKQHIFAELATLPNVVVLHHARNLGKGEALKTGMKWMLNNCPNVVGAVTVDADGQHRLEDIKKVAAALLQFPDAYILGVRAFDTKVPLRSRFGNTLTRTLFQWRYRAQIQDTQTGLRGIPRALMKEFLQISAGRYEYEMACLIYAVREKINMQQVQVGTVYLEDNVSSHFNPILDSIRIYYLFLRLALKRSKNSKKASGTDKTII